MKKKSCAPYHGRYLEAVGYQSKIKDLDPNKDGWDGYGRMADKERKEVKIESRYRKGKRTLTG
jgi:hypothetical protein